MECQTVRRYFIEDALGAQNSYGHDVTHIENTMDKQLGSFDITAGKLVPVENFYKDPEATKRIKFYVLR